MNPSSEEKIFLNGGGILITQTRLVVQGQTFMLTDVSAARVEYSPRFKAIPLALLVFGGLLALLVWNAVAWTKPERIPDQFLWSRIVIAFGVLMMVAGGLFLFRKGAYAIVITVAGAEVQTWQTKDRGFADKIVAAVNETIAGMETAR